MWGTVVCYGGEKYWYITCDSGILQFSSHFFNHVDDWDLNASWKKKDEKIKPESNRPVLKMTEGSEFWKNCLQLVNYLVT